MVLNERVGMVVTLCHEIGPGGDCSQYFPTKSTGEQIKFKSIPYQVTLISETELNKSTTLRCLEVKDLDDSERTQSLKHYHFRGWPDWQTPVNQSRKDFEALVD